MSNPLAIATVVVFALAAGCAAPGWSGDVTALGTMREVLRDGHTEARADVATLRGDTTLYAVGALERLEGEVTIDGGDAWASRPRGGEVVTQRGAGASGGAALLLSAHVREWREVAVTRDIDPSEFADFVRSAAADAGLDTSRPFPFLVDGTLVHFEGHVIAGDCPMRARMLGRAPEPPPFEISRPAVNARLVGFYAEGHEGEMTHHGVRFHGHVLLDGERPLTAHVESAGVAKGAALRLPAR